MNGKSIAFLGLSLGHRHLDLLQLLFTYPLLHVREMAALLEREVSSIERYLRVLQRSGCIVPMVTDGGQRWRLSERGLRLIAATQHINIQSIATQQESDEGATSRSTVEWMCSYVIWSTLPVSMDSSRLYPRQPARSDYRDANTACSGGKQGQPVNGAIAIMITGTISGLMH